MSGSRPIAYRIQARIAEAGPQSAQQIAQHFGMTITVACRALWRMTVRGELVSHGKQRHMRYTVGVPPKFTGPRSRDDKLARRRELAIKRERAKGVQPRAAKAKAAPKPEPAAPPPPERVETVDEWRARTGRDVERLPLHACSQPLRFIGHRAENDRTWRERQKQEQRA